MNHSNQFYYSLNSTSFLIPLAFFYYFLHKTTIIMTLAITTAAIIPTTIPTIAPLDKLFFSTQ